LNEEGDQRRASLTMTEGSSIPQPRHYRSLSAISGRSKAPNGFRPFGHRPVEWG